MWAGGGVGGGGGARGGICGETWGSRQAGRQGKRRKGLGQDVAVVEWWWPGPPRGGEPRQRQRRRRHGRNPPSLSPARPPARCDAHGRPPQLPPLSLHPPKGFSRMSRTKLPWAGAAPPRPPRSPPPPPPPPPYSVAQWLRRCSHTCGVWGYIHVYTRSEGVARNGGIFGVWVWVVLAVQGSEVQRWRGGGRMKSAEHTHAPPSGRTFFHFLLAQSPPNIHTHTQPHNRKHTPAGTPRAAEPDRTAAPGVRPDPPAHRYPPPPPPLRQPLPLQPPLPPPRPRCRAESPPPARRRWRRPPPVPMPPAPRP